MAWYGMAGLGKLWMLFCGGGGNGGGGGIHQERKEKTRTWKSNV
jgi:hypothetical protein